MVIIGFVDTANLAGVPHEAVYDFGSYLHIIRLLYLVLEVRVFEGEDRQKNVTLAIEMIRNSSIPQECYQVASEYRDKACHSLSSLPENSTRQSLTKLADYVVSRKN